ncbi:MAG: PPC domain-containing protein [Planctomycetales bacterium]|nr:PPC domain-containing protein [Planctomycetales bacterium]
MMSRLATVPDAFASWRATRTILALCVVMSAARAGEPRLDRLEPQGAQRGTVATIDFVGPRIGKAPQGLVLEHPGLEVRKLESVDGNRLRAELALAADCRLGIHPVRVHTATGLSNLVTLHVGALTEASEAEPNDSAGEPQMIELDTVINGVVKPADVDCYAVELQSGDRLSVEIEGLRLGRTFFDPAIAVLGPDGAEVAFCDDAAPAHQDAFLSLIAGQAGRHVVVVRDSAMQGNDASSYRLHVGRFPRPAAVYPPGGRPGEKLEVRWIGDAAGDRTETIQLPAEATDEFLCHAADERGVSPSPLTLRVVDVPNVLEVEPNNGREQATEMPAVAAACGVIDADGDLDHFRFAAKKGQAIDLRLYAQQIGSPLDGILRVYKLDGRQLAANDDDRGEPDSYLRFNPPEDGEYLVRIEDRIQQGGPHYVYRIEATRPAPVVDVRIEEQRRYESQTVVVPRGNRTAIMVTASRRDVGGPLHVTAGDLPAGVSVQTPELAGDYNRVPMVFDATADAPVTAGLYSLTATPAEQGKQLASRFLQQTWLVRGRNNFPVWNYFAPRPAIAVTEPAPFRLRLVEMQAPLVQNGSKNLQVVAERDEGFTAGIRIRTLYNPPGVSANNSLSIREKENEAALPVTAGGNAKPGDWDMVVVGEADVDGRIVVSTQLAKMRVAPGHMGLTFGTVATGQGVDAEYVIPLEQRTPFDGVAKLELLGLPPGVTAPVVEIDKTAEQVVFPLTVAADARVGRHRSVMCRVTLTEAGEPVVQTVGSGELRIDPQKPPGEQAAGTTAAGAEDKS